jgi:amidase
VLSGFGNEDLGQAALILPDEVWQGIDDEVVTALAPVITRLEKSVPSLERTAISAQLGGIEFPNSFAGIYDKVGYQAYQNHRHFIEKYQPIFAPRIAERLAYSAAAARQEFLTAIAKAGDLRRKFKHGMASNQILVFPTTVVTAPELTMREEELVAVRRVILVTSGMAPILGFPEITIPGGEMNGKPIGLSLMALSGGDELLLQIAEDYGQS